MDILGISELVAAGNNVLIKLMEAVLHKMPFYAVVLLMVVIFSICYLCRFEPRQPERQ